MIKFKIKHIYFRENAIYLLTLTSKSIFYQFFLKYVQFLSLKAHKFPECLLHNLPYISYRYFVHCIKKYYLLVAYSEHTVFLRKESLVLNVNTLVLNAYLGSELTL